MHRTTRLKIGDLNPHLMCALCGGYLIDATSINECLHSFCRTCILKYLENSKYCPICDVQVHKTKPYLNIRPDKTLQSLVYKLVPSLFKDEMKRRQDYYRSHPLDDIAGGSNASEARGEVSAESSIYTDDEKISLCLQHCHKLPAYKHGVLFGPINNTDEMYKECDRRYLLCPAAFTIGLLKKFIRLKFELTPHFQIYLFHSDENLQDDYTLMDVAYIYSWRRVDPLKLYYIVHDQTKTDFELPKPPQHYIMPTTCSRKRNKKFSDSSENSANVSEAEEIYTCKNNSNDDDRLSIASTIPAIGSDDQASDDSNDTMPLDSVPKADEECANKALDIRNDFISNEYDSNDELITNKNKPSSSVMNDRDKTNENEFSNQSMKISSNETTKNLCSDELLNSPISDDLLKTPCSEERMRSPYSEGIINNPCSEEAYRYSDDYKVNNDTDIPHSNVFTPLTIDVNSLIAHKNKTCDSLKKKNVHPPRPPYFVSPKKRSLDKRGDPIHHPEKRAKVTITVERNKKNNEKKT